MRKLTVRSPLSAVLLSEDARRLLGDSVPEFLESPIAQQLVDFPVAALMRLAVGEDDSRIDGTLAALVELDDMRLVEPEEPPILPRADYEDASVPLASATFTVPSGAVWEPVDVVLTGPAHGNPFVDVDVDALFESGSTTQRVGGFYDGDGRYVLRFLPPASGTWRFTTRSNARSLDGVTGEVAVSSSAQPGPVGVVDTFHFAHADGTAYRPWGTTLYAWTQQSEQLQEQTLDALASAPFNKVRMCVFPKDFIYNRDDPERFAWERDENGGWDTTRFDLEFWRVLERRVAQLGELGIQADVIAFHPYDRWGFATQSRAADDRYAAYLARRLGGYANVWWSLANEYDLLIAKDPEDWDRIADIFQRESTARHLLSIHNWVEQWDYTSPWATHTSIQHGERLSHNVDRWRARWGKPVIVDELGYEGDLDQGWGSLTAEEFVRRVWEIVLRGGYATHGETFYRSDEVIWWSKGGTLAGESPARIRFLQRLVAESPSGRLDPLPSDWDAVWGGVAGEYILISFGAARPAFRNVVIPEGMRAEIDVIDTWGMTVDRLDGVFEGEVRVPLPARPYVAIRLRRVA